MEAEKNTGIEYAKSLVDRLAAVHTLELSRIQQDIHKFTLKFDYRNKDME